MPRAARVRLVRMLAPQGELVAVLAGGGLVQAMLADQGDAGRGSRITTAVGDDRFAA
jgi:hypothetical protein